MLLDNRQQLLAEFDKNASAARAALASVSDAGMMKNWRLLAGGQEIFSLPRAACIRGMVLNHHIHHRAQLTVYLRLLNVAERKNCVREMRVNVALLNCDSPHRSGRGRETSKYYDKMASAAFRARNRY